MLKMGMFDQLSNASNTLETNCEVSSRFQWSKWCPNSYWLWNDHRSMSTIDLDDVKENDETMIISSSDKQRTNKQKVIEKTSN